MQKIIERHELQEMLDQLKQALQNFDYSTLYNVIFFNLYSYYLFMSKISAGEKKEKTIHGILDEIERYIPMGLTNTSLDLFLNVAAMPEQTNGDELSKIFSCRCRMDFINLVRITKDKKAWEEICALCEDLRQEQQKSQYYFV